MTTSSSRKTNLAAPTIVLTLSGGCYLLAVTSYLATFDSIWELLRKIQEQIQLLGVVSQQPCWLCGMSLAFRALWRADFGTAFGLNHASPLLFALMILGCLAGSIYAISLAYYKRPKVQTASYAV